MMNEGAKINPEAMRFSVIIPTWNNLELLKLCIRSIRQNSFFKNQIIIFANEATDGTLEWLEQEKDLDYLHAEENVGICVAMNSCRHLVRSSYIVYMNDDMYACPNWDKELYAEIEKIGHDNFMLSATLIEPYAVNNPSYVSIVADYGDSVENFKEEKLLKEYAAYEKANWSGSSWPPSVISTRMWDIIGGYSIEFSPGMYSDPDLSMKLWKYGVRIFMGVGKSKVYHFQSKSTKRLKKNKGSNTFLMKWGITAKTFYRYYLRMGKDYSGPLAKPILPETESVRNLLKRVFGGMSNEL